MYNQKLQYHFRPKSGWINDPNGLVFYKGYYHVFYQHQPHFEVPAMEPMYWGHARTKDFLTWEELPLALYPVNEYDCGGCWSGTAIVKDDILYLFYASIVFDDQGKSTQTVSIAYSDDGINFSKFEGNPVIDHYPADGSPDFRDPALCYVDGTYYCVMASGNPQCKKARLLLYKSQDLFNWTYNGIMAEWDNSVWCECPSFLHTADGKFLLACSVLPVGARHYFSLMYGTFENGIFKAESVASVDKGPDQYAGQAFSDHKGRNILISWMPGWEYQGYVDHDVGCMSLPKELHVKNGKITAYPVSEVQHLLRDEDECVKRMADGFVIERAGRDPVIYKGHIHDIKIMRDAYMVEVFVNYGEEVYSVLL